MQILPLWAQHCPVCNVSRLKPATTKVLWEAPEATSGLRCENCRALFNHRDDKFALVYVKNTTREFWVQYNNIPMTSDEWNSIIGYDRL